MTWRWGCAQAGGHCPPRDRGSHTSISYQAVLRPLPRWRHHVAHRPCLGRFPLRLLIWGVLEEAPGDREEDEQGWTSAGGARTPPSHPTRLRAGLKAQDSREGARG